MRWSSLVSSIKICGLAFLLLSSLAVGASLDRTTLAANFVAPPNDARPWVYWMWLSSNLSQAGITADLEAMQRVGIGGALIMDIEQGTPPGPMQYMDAQWQEMFKYAVREAKRLGLELNVNNGPGYYGSGGTWVPPEKGMQSLVESETFVRGGDHFDGLLPRPHVSTDDPPAKVWWSDGTPAPRFPPGADYRDIAVLAVPTPLSDHAKMIEADPSFTDGAEKMLRSPTSTTPMVISSDPAHHEDAIEVSFPKLYTAGVLEINLHTLTEPVACELEAQDLQTKGWQRVKSFSVGPYDWRSTSAAFSFEPTTAMHYRLRLADHHPLGLKLELTSLELHLRYRIDDPMRTKLLGWHGWIGFAGAQSAPLDARLPAAAAVASAQIINLTAKMSPDGHLNWDPPAGEWTILRIGHAFTGSLIGPTPDVTAGPETDKLSAEATALHFDAMVKKLHDLIPSADRDAWKTVHIDSWEGGGQNWTPRMRDEFIKRRGYDPIPFLPIAFGRVLDDLQTSERFLWDLRKTVSELMVENYVAPMQRLAHAQNLRLSFESYTTIGNDLDAANYIDEPIAEFWPHRPTDGFRATGKEMASAAHLNGHNIVGAESFDGDEQERWLEHPATIKPFADELLTTGVNRIIVHRYAMQRFLNRYPGLQMGPWGQHYERTQTWWDLTGPWHQYLTRCQYLLRQGQSVSDVVQLQSEEPLLRYTTTHLEGYDDDACSPDALAKLTVRNHDLVSTGGTVYKLLTLAHTGTMTVPLLTRVRDLVREGASILGEPPRATPGLTDRLESTEKLTALVKEIWGEDSTTTIHRLGHGQVFRGLPPETALEKLGVPPDFACNLPVHWIHRREGKLDIYFIANPSAKPVLANCIFRADSPYPERWDAETGQIAPLSIRSVAADGRTHLALSLAAEGSAFVIFSSDDTHPNADIVKVSRDNETLFINGASRGAAEPSILENGTTRLPGHYQFSFADGKTKVIDIPQLNADFTLTTPWTVDFTANWGAPPEVTFPKLTSWTDRPEPGIKHFSGTAVYHTTFRVTSAQLAAGRRLGLNLGNVQVIARVKLNGRDLGIVWRAPYRVNITKSAKIGENTLEVAVTNLWVNRLIGDESMPEDSERNPDGTLKAWPSWLLEGKPSPTGRFTFSSWRLWKKGESLQPSGLIGPVTLTVSAELPFLGFRN